MSEAVIDASVNGCDDQFIWGIKNNNWTGEAPDL